MTALTELVSVTKIYSAQSRVDIGDVAFAPGERVFVAGSNGSGKSTLLRILAGVSQPTTGEVRRSDAWRSARIGFVPQSGGCTMTCRSPAISR